MVHRLLIVVALLLVCSTAQASTLDVLLRITTQSQEPQLEREARLAIVATAIDIAVERATCQGSFASNKFETCTPIWRDDPTLLTRYLVTIGWWESHFAANVHANECGPYECDAKRFLDPNGNLLRVVHRARSPWQFQRWGYVAEDWDAYQGDDLESTKHAAWAASKVISRAHSACRTPERALTYYATGGRCVSSRFHQARLRANWLNYLEL